MGLPKGLDFAGGAIVTLVLDDFQQLTGRFIGVLDDDRKQFKGGHHDPCKPEPDPCCKKPEPPDPCCKPGHLEVEVEDSREFLVLQLSEASGVTSLTSATPTIVGGVVTAVALGFTSTSFAAGSFVAINVDRIIYAATGGVTSTFTIPIIL
ncbi:hypothetical protein [Propionispora hippei]|uniref:Uncharacterized protein n=1 Tax=Propionispora hippei DSM 15287 TaxID=1123003 RepID=A0A1M6LKD0_9FIRM|nr:hypothetical protein [Propionispora hippei]SHJ71602.1 hypothetical protein SAMN02745170_03146 [Propionispora hippei DSM 15287]